VIEPPPSLVDLVKGDKGSDAIWKKWLNNFRNWALENMSTDWLIEVNKGNIDGHELVHKFGWRGNVSTNHHHLWNDPTANTSMTFPTVAETYDVVTTGNDTSAGAGARKVVIEYLDSSFEFQTGEVITNAGTQASTFSGIRLIRAYVTDCGTYGGTNENLITFTGTDSGNDYAFIEGTEGQTQHTQYCIPAGKTGYILRVSMTTEANKGVNIKLHQRQDADDVSTPFTGQRLLHQWDGVEVPLSEEFKANHGLPEKTDIWVGCDMVSGSGIVQFDYDILLVDN